MREAWQLLWGAHLILGPYLNSWNPTDMGPNNSTTGKKGCGLGHSGWCLGHLIVLLARGLLPSHVATPCDVSTGKGAEVPQLTPSECPRLHVEISSQLWNWDYVTSLLNMLWL